ncbi:MAG: ABC transporter substrate-binding protein [Chloroflexota bacterium]
MLRRAITKKQMEAVHPRIPDVYEQLKQGRVSRRDFLRTATLLGMSAGVATVAAACGGGTVQVGAPASDSGSESTTDSSSESSSSEMVGGIKRGGILRTATQVKAADHPARYSWIFDANETRHVFEYLTETGNDNITRPYLLESWEPNEDLSVWTLNLRQGIMWTNGDELIADHVKYNFGEWLNPDNGSSILGLWEGFLTIDGVEVVDDYTIKLNLEGSLLAVPEQLFHYPAQIMHPSFNGDITSGDNPSTGPMVIKEFVVGERVVLEAREDYWQMGEDGNPLPYLDGMEFIDLGDDQTAYVAALLSGQVDRIYDANPDTFSAVNGNDDVRVEGVGTAATRVLRFRVDQEPWDNNDVRTAVKMCQDRAKILDAAYFGEGMEGYDTHISPVHPAWAPMDLPEYDPEGAQALLEEAGFGDGLDLSISVGTGWPDIVAYAETLQEDAKAAGINITLDTMPNSAYWDLWTETPVGITTWAHRTLAVMLLPLAYINDAEGTPVPWNETRWHDDEFAEILSKAQGEADVEVRRGYYADLQRIQQERGSIGVAYFINRWLIANPGFQNIGAHPTDYNLYREAWYDPDMDTLRG